MTLSTLDIVAVIIALVTACTLIITSAVQNARLTRSRNEYRTAYLASSERWAKQMESCTHGLDCECERV